MATNAENDNISLSTPVLPYGSLPHAYGLGTRITEDLSSSFNTSTGTPGLGQDINIQQPTTWFPSFPDQLMMGTFSRFLPETEAPFNRRVDVQTNRQVEQRIYSNPRIGCPPHQPPVHDSRASIQLDPVHPSSGNFPNIGLHPNFRHGLPYDVNFSEAPALMSQMTSENLYGHAASPQANHSASRRIYQGHGTHQFGQGHGNISLQQARSNFRSNGDDQKFQSDFSYGNVHQDQGNNTWPEQGPPLLSRSHPNLDTAAISAFGPIPGEGSGQEEAIDDAWMAQGGETIKRVNLTYKQWPEVAKFFDKRAFLCPGPDITIPAKLDQKQLLVKRLLVAICNTNDAIKGPRWDEDSEYYTVDQHERLAWRLLELLRELHLYGWTFPVDDKATMTDVLRTKDMTFRERFESVEKYLTVCKRRCEDLLKCDHIYRVIGMPTKLMTDMRSNKTNNEIRQGLLDADRATKSKKQRLAPANKRENKSGTRAQQVQNDGSGLQDSSLSRKVQTATRKRGRAENVNHTRDVEEGLRGSVNDEVKAQRSKTNRARTTKKVVKDTTSSPATPLQTTGSRSSTARQRSARKTKK